ncbi:MAG: hypothetical protein HQL47_06380 [Gammaproteobacteria bacterium]|nr:hypothetical protein [Gammaproteobacteria bacterium]
MPKPLPIFAMLASGPAFAHGDHGHSFADLMLHLLSDAFHLWPLGLGVIGALLLGFMLYQPRKSAPGQISSHE